MEKAEKKRYSLKTKEEPTEKGKRHSKLYKQNFDDNGVPNSNALMQQQVPIYQKQMMLHLKRIKHSFRLIILWANRYITSD